MKKWACPECGGTRLAEWSRVYVRQQITEWSDDGDAVGYDEPMIDWDSCESAEANGYQCLDCGAEEVSPVEVQQ